MGFVQQIMPDVLEAGLVSTGRPLRFLSDLASPFSHSFFFLNLEVMCDIIWSASYDLKYFYHFSMSYKLYYACCSKSISFEQRF